MSIWALPFDDAGKPGKPFPVVQTKAEEREAEFSPNGKWIAYQSTASGRSEVYIQPFPADADSLLLPISTSWRGPAPLGKQHRAVLYRFGRTAYVGSDPLQC